ncbi:MAG: SDR family oxidoreductase [Pseudomonadota bacterium]
MTARFADKTVVVTGGANGIGRATAWRLLREGARVTVFDKVDPDSDPVRVLFDESGDHRDRLAYHSVDLTEPDQVQQTADRVLSDGPVAALAMVAGLSQPRKKIEKVSLEEWQSFLAINLTNPFLVAQALLPSMREQRYGRIVAISSSSGRTASVWTGLPYSSAKAGVIGLIRKLAFDEGRYGITANVVAPGLAETEFVKAGLKQAPEGFLEQRLAEIPLRRGAHPDEMAAAIAFLASDDASYVTGAVLDVNGGAFIG